MPWELFMRQFLLIPLVFSLSGCTPQVDGTCADCEGVCLGVFTEGRGEVTCVQTPDECPELTDTCTEDNQAVPLTEGCRQAYEEPCGGRYVDDDAYCQESCVGDECSYVPDVTCSY